MRRRGLAAWLAGATMVLAAAGSAGSAPAPPERHAAPLAGSKLTLQQVDVDRTGIILAANWMAAKGSGTWTPPFGSATYQYPLPDTIPAAGVNVTLSVTAVAAPTSRFAPALGISSESQIGIENGPAQAGALAEPGETKTGTKTIKLVPRTHANGALVKVIVGLQDGPRITYTYKASNPAPKCKPFRAAASARASQACLEVAKFVVSAFHPARVRAPTGRRVARRWVLKGGNSVAQTVPFLTYYEGESEQDPARTRGSVLRLKVTGADLRTSGVVEVAKLDFTVDDVRERDPLIDIMLRCREGARGSIVLIDDDRRLAGGDADQTRDKVVVSLPACPYHSHTYSNADSLTHEPFAGGGNQGGQRAVVTIRTSG